MNSVSDTTFLILSDQAPDLTPSTGLWDTVKSWGRKITPVLPRVFTGTTATVSFFASAFFLLQKNHYTHFPPATERALEAICWTSLGTSSRIMIELLSSSNEEFYAQLQQVHNTTTGLAHWCFFTLWNVSLNVEDEMLKKSLYGVISTLFGYNLAHDCLQALKSLGYGFIDLDEETQESALLNVQENEQSINNGEEEDTPGSLSEPLLMPLQLTPSLLLEPLFTDAKKVLLYNAIKIACGGTTAFLNTFQNPKSELYLLVNTFGYLLIGSGLGEIGLEGLSHFQKKVEACTDLSSKNCCSRLRKWGMKAINLTLTATPIVLIEVNMLFQIFNPGNNAMGILIGMAYGKTKYDAKREFQALTSQVENSKKRKNQTLQTGCWQGLKENRMCQALGLVEDDRRLRTAILVDRIITIPLFLGLTGFTIAVALDTDSVRHQIAISALLISTMGMTAFSALLKRYFQPGKNSRLFNELYFNVFENTEFLPLVYSILTQMGDIDDESIGKHDSLQFAFSLLGMTTFGSLLSIVRVESGDSRRNPSIYTSPVYRMSSWLTFLKLAKGK